MYLNTNYWKVFRDGYTGYGSYLWKEITQPSWHNYFYALIAVSIFFLLLEWLRPWRKGQARFRKDFWLDAFYMFFNFFLFSLLIYNAASDVVVRLFNDIIMGVSGFDLQAANPMTNWPLWAILLTGFVVRDFVQWWVHRLLHRNAHLWQFHKVHHSVKEMGFAAHLRYHWMENVVYRSIEYLPLALLGIGLYDFFIIHIFSLFIGHFNHSNISVSPSLSGSFLGGLLGLMIGSSAYEISLFPSVNFLSVSLSLLAGALIGYFLLSRIIRKLFNNPEMHIWHHAYHLPEGKAFGVNFGISLAIWDYLFGTAYIPYEGRDIRLGFPEDGKFPVSFWSHLIYGFGSKSGQSKD